MLQDAAVERAPEMTTGSWIFMFSAWVFVATLLVWSFKRVLSEPGEAPETDIAGPPGG
ncbi:MAG: hypothetical protein DHS20C15_22500 [Planctomycetota bacterium]|nr:MAG: hypothetical protein DHS20C15_22500 [Planctomycetota bacterium]